MALSQWLPTQTYNTVRTTPTFDVLEGQNNAHIELTSNQWQPSSNGVTLTLYWLPPDGSPAQVWQAFSCLQGDRTSKGNMPQVSVSRLPEQGTGPFKAYAEIAPIGSIRVGVAGEITG